jgi:hypothetical protein
MYLVMKHQKISIAKYTYFCRGTRHCALAVGYLSLILNDI